MALISDEDIQVQLPIDKLNIDNIPDDVVEVKKDVERIIRGYLSPFFEAATLAAWTDPDSTPGQIRAIGGRLGAALIYRVRYSEDSLNDPEFAQVKYDQAMAMLMGVANGTIILDDVDDVGTQFDNSYFFPNSTTADPIFTIGAQF